MLLHMAEQRGPVTSEALAAMMRTNPVVVRRIMAGLREQGVVQSARGHGGGWTLARDLADVTLRDIYDGIGAPALFAIGNRSEAPDCAVEQAVNSALGVSLSEAEALLLSSFGRVTLAQLSADFHQRLARRAVDCGIGEPERAQTPSLRRSVSCATSPTPRWWRATPSGRGGSCRGWRRCTG